MPRRNKAYSSWAKKAQLMRTVYYGTRVDSAAAERDELNKLQPDHRDNLSPDSTSSTSAQVGGVNPPIIDPLPTTGDPAEDPLHSEVDTVVVKVETDEFSEEEDDPLEQLEMKRQREREITEAKKPKWDSVRVVEKVEVPIQRNATPSTSNNSKSSTNQVMIPEIFMKNMLRTQNEILDTLKSQVLMQNPDPKVLTFLRFLGAKMQKLSAERRKELQDRVTEMVLSEYDV